MATFQTREGEAVIVEGSRSNPSLFVEARYQVDGGFSKTLDERVYSVYALGADTFEKVPQSRGDVDSAVMADLVDRVIGYIVAKVDGADRRRDVELHRVEVYEQDDVAKADLPAEPTWLDDWDPGATKSEKVRLLLENGYSDKRAAAVAGCSRSLVSEVRARED